MRSRIFFREFLRSDFAVLWGIALVPLVLHLLFIDHYGYSRDEFYYIACGEHLDWGYVDHPPLIALVAFLISKTLGTSLPAIRILPALAVSAAVVLTGMMARELGAGRFGQGLAALGVALAPIYLFLGHVLSMNAFDFLFWALAAYVLILILKCDRPKLWPLFGLIAGVGLMDKYSMGFMGAGVLVGLVVVAEWKHFKSKWLWLGGALAFAIFLPHILWEIHTGFPTREFIANAGSNKIVPLSPFGFLKLAALAANPVTLPIWLAGLGYLLFARQVRPFRVLGWMSVFVFGLLIATRSKPYYAAPAFPVMMAAGGVAIATLIDRFRLVWLKPVVLAAVALSQVILVPLFVPVLPIETYIRYARFIGLDVPSGERNKIGKLPQHFADMFGWENLVANVARVYNSLPPDDRAKCAIYTTNYGRAGAIDLFGRQYGLPKSICGHNSYFLWGPRDYTGEVMLVVGDNPEELRKVFVEVIVAAKTTSEFSMPYENNVLIMICRKPNVPLKTLWPLTKSYG
jgi:4-amino-4-deoxy-L-arabinose transferase-like glycosyltransferase